MVRNLVLNMIRKRRLIILRLKIQISTFRNETCNSFKFPFSSTPNTLETFLKI